MHDLFQQISTLPAPFNMVVLLVLIIMGTGVITSLMKQIRKFACHRQDVEFKREMLDRGLSADEIEQIIRAKVPEKSDGSKCI